jgi:hypothetical protein
MRDHREFVKQEAERRMVELGRAEATGTAALIIILLVCWLRYRLSGRISVGMVGVPMSVNYANPPCADARGNIGGRE